MGAAMRSKAMSPRLPIFRYACADIPDPGTQVTRHADSARYNASGERDPLAVSGATLHHYFT